MVERCGLGKVNSVPVERKKEGRRKGRRKGGREDGREDGRTRGRRGRRGVSVRSANVSGLSVKNVIPISMVFPPHTTQGPL